MKIYIISFVLIYCNILLSNCAEDNSNSTKTILHPNKDSELTLLMRDMYDYYDSLKINITNDQIPSKIRHFHEIHSAVATEPSKSESQLYKTMSKVYLESAERMSSNTDNLADVFNNMIDNCMNCHKQMYPGPMVKIKKLYI